MDKLAKVKSEVERMHNLLPVVDGDNISVNYADRICTTLEMYIDSLQEEPVSEELEEAAHEYADLRRLNYETAFYAFMSGSKWQKQQDLSTIELAEDHAMLAGMEKMKEQMMKDAVEVTITGDCAIIFPKAIGENGDKVKVIVIKED